MPWPKRCFPHLRSAGRYPHADRHFQTLYRGPTHALHLYEYAGVIRFEDEEQPFGPGTLTLSPSGLGTSYDLPAPGYHWCIHFFPEPADAEAAQLPLLLDSGPRLVLLREQVVHVCRLHSRSLQDPGATGEAALAAGAALQSLLLWLGLLHRQGPVPAPPSQLEATLEKVLMRIHERLDRVLSVPALAREAGCSQNYLARCFRRQYGITIPGYILQARMSQACHLLASTQLPIKEIAARSGMPDAQHFNKQFRRLTGGSPSAYRARFALGPDR